MRYTYLKHVFGSETVDVVVDRRVGQRRHGQESMTVEKRRNVRRQRDITGELQKFGWALVRR